MNYRNVKNYVALTLAIKTNLTAENVFEMISENPEIIERFKIKHHYKEVQYAKSLY